MKSISFSAVSKLWLTYFELRGNYKFPSNLYMSLFGSSD